MKLPVLVSVTYEPDTGRLHVLTLPHDNGKTPAKRSTLIDGVYDTLDELGKALDAAFVSVRNQLLRELAQTHQVR